MSINPMAWDGGLNTLALEHPSAKGCYMNMGQVWSIVLSANLNPHFICLMLQTSEEVADRYHISRQKQDEFSVQSHKKAEAAIKAGRFKDEILPITVQVEDPKTHEMKTVTVSQGMPTCNIFSGG